MGVKVRRCRCRWCRWCKSFHLYLNGPITPFSWELLLKMADKFQNGCLWWEIVQFSRQWCAERLPTRSNLLLPVPGYADFTPCTHSSWHSHIYLLHYSSYLEPGTDHLNIEVCYTQTPHHGHACIHALAPQIHSFTPPPCMYWCFGMFLIYLLHHPVYLEPGTDHLNIEVHHLQTPHHGYACIHALALQIT